ncbi:uncharacterized protein LOC143276772 isoform X2 [Babylonia areolata]
MAEARGSKSDSPPGVAIYKPKNVILTTQNVTVTSRLPFDGGAAEQSGIQDLCPESLVVALLKEILYHCPGRKEALFTLEEKLCSKLHQVKGKRVVSFGEHFHITFREFLDNHSQHFRVVFDGNDFIVSRVVHSPGEGASSVTDRKSPDDSWNRSHQYQEQDESSINTTLQGAWRRKMGSTSPSKHQSEAEETSLERSSLTSEPKRNMNPQQDSLKSALDPERQTATQEVLPGKASSFHESCIADESRGGLSKSAGLVFQASREPSGNSTLTTLLWTKPSDTVVFKVSDEGYTGNPLKFTIDVVSLWNSPDRDLAFIVLGVKPLVNPPHQVVGLKSARKQGFYDEIFLWKMFDFPPKFKYTETEFESKRVGIVQIEKSASCIQPSTVKSDEKKPHLTKNQLWFRKEGKNTAAAGSDMSDEHVRRICSWFMQSRVRHFTDPSEECESQDWMLNTGSKPTERITACYDQISEHGSDSSSMPPSPNSAEEPCTSPSCHPHTAPTDTDRGGGSQTRTRPPSELMKAVQHFGKGHFILMCGTLSRTAPNLDALSSVPWIAVYDFDVCGRETGLLAYMEHGLKQKRSTGVFSWMDPHAAVTERGTQWWSLRGRLEIPDSNLSELTPMQWLRKVCDKLEKLCAELARLSQDYTVLSILVLWPDSKEEMKCMQKFLHEVQKRINVHPSVFLCFTENGAADRNSFEVQSIMEESEGSVRKVEVNLEDFCTEVDIMFSSIDSGVFKFQLPGETASVDVRVEDAAWLTQDFEVLYLQNPYTHKEMTAEDLQEEGNNFFRGGSLSWLARYDMGSTCFDIERCHSSEITKHIIKQYVERFRGGVIHILHAPGSGGSTMAQRILFNLHETTPCVHVKQRSGSTVEDVAERLRFLANSTHMPVVALFDGEEEQKLQFLRIQVGHCMVVFIQVKRYPYEIDPKRMVVEHKNKFYVQGLVTRKESRNLVIQFKNHCDNEGKKRALHMLDTDVQENRQGHQMFEYGLTVFDYEFRGMQAYVRGYLGSCSSHWQKCLCYLALVYYYAQVSLPCCFIGNIGESTGAFVDIHDLPFPVQMLVVRDVNEGKRNYIRVMHYTVALEMLEQMLNAGGQRSGTENLSQAAKQNLKSICLDFLDKVAGTTGSASFALQSVLTKTFIMRDVTEMVDEETETKKKSQFSAILMDLDSEAPYHGRLQVLQKLSEICPEDANCRAHLGRFYSLCRPDEEEEAEKNFTDAVRMASQVEQHSGNDLAFIYHMYGCFFQRKIMRKLSSFSGASFSDVIEDAEQACKKFLFCRYYALPAMREPLPYFSEIDVRLRVCLFIGRIVPGGLSAVLQSQQQTSAGTEYHFIKTSIVEIQDLFTECFNTTLLDEGTWGELQSRMKQFNSTFRGLVREIQTLAEDDPVTRLRLKVTAKKLQYACEDGVVFVENHSMPTDVITYVVDTLEDILKIEGGNHILKDKLELDYRDWILAIRNPSFPKIYSVESVLEDVRRWHRLMERTPSVAIFYHFVLLSLLGLGTSTSPGNEECLADALELKAGVYKQSRADPKARHPREWLGKDEGSGIRRLLSRGYVPLDNHRLTATARSQLAVCKGTVKGKPTRARGLIVMDFPSPKDKKNRRSIEVFFVPARTETTRPFLKGSRVEFYLAFTQEHGYEAYEVTPLERSQCRSCGLWVEITSDSRSQRCHGTTSKGRPCTATVCRRDLGGLHGQM